MRALINGPAVVLKPDVAQAMAAALHELATNAVKYGALSVTSGTGSGRVVARGRRTPRTPLDRGGRSARQSPDAQGIWHQCAGDHDYGVKGRVQLDWHAEGLACEIAVPT